MAYKQRQFKHSDDLKTGVIIANLGTPEAPTARALKPYLKQFLSDPRVVEFPRLLWWLILNGIILNVRPRKSAQAYAKVWTEQGSPLAWHTQAQAQALQESLREQNVIVDWAMRYGEPALDKVIQAMLDQGVDRLLLLPLYPQYSAATTASTFDALAGDFCQRRWLPAFRFVSSYHDHPLYIELLAKTVREQWQASSKAQKLIFSYHGVPLRYLHQGDPYHCQCLKTSRLVAEALGLAESEYLTCFQSRFGREEWLQPYTDQTLKKLAREGTESVQLICPGFAADCLETIEEIGEENRDYFLEAGGKRYEYIPALNSRPEHIELLKILVLENTGGWLLAPTDSAELETRNQRAERCQHNQV